MAKLHFWEVRYYDHRGRFVDSTVFTDKEKLVEFVIDEINHLPERDSIRIWNRGEDIPKIKGEE
mgnify:CR=1 FL=1